MSMSMSMSTSTSIDPRAVGGASCHVAGTHWALDDTPHKGTSTGHFLGLNPVFVRKNAAQLPGRPTYSFALSWVS